MAENLVTHTDKTGHTLTQTPSCPSASFACRRQHPWPPSPCPLCPSSAPPCWYWPRSAMQGHQQGVQGHAQYSSGEQRTSTNSRRHQAVQAQGSAHSKPPHPPQHDAAPTAAAARAAAALQLTPLARQLTVTEALTPCSCACAVCIFLIWARSRTSCCARIRVPALLPCLAAALISCRAQARRAGTHHRCR